MSRAKRRAVTNRAINGDKLEGSSSANVILYVGLGMVCIGLIITFVGIGDKGFQTLELKLIGPSLVGCGVFFALLRILFCTVPACCAGCFSCCCRTKKKDESERLLAIEKLNMENSLGRTMNRERLRTVKHPVTGDRRGPSNTKHRSAQAQDRSVYWSHSQYYTDNSPNSPLEKSGLVPRGETIFGPF